MKVGLISNSNHFNFTICRYLRDRGLDAELLVTADEGPETMHHPGRDCYDDSYKAYCHDVNWGATADSTFLQAALGNKKKINEVQNTLQHYERLIGTQIAPALCEKTGCRLDIQIPMGFDTRGMPYRRWWPTAYRGKANYLEYNIRAPYQRQGIKHARAILTGLNATDEVKALQPEGEIVNLPIPAIYTGMYNRKVIEQNAHTSGWNESFRTLRAENDLLICSQNRHGWKDYGNDKLLHALKLFKEKEPNTRFTLITFEYGTDVGLSKKLAAELGIEKEVAWFPAMSRKELAIALQMSDIGINELNIGAFMAGSIFECLALGIPLFQKRNDAHYKNLFPELPPVFNVQSPEEICEGMQAYLRNPEPFRKNGTEAMNWYQEYVVTKTINKIIDVIGTP